MLNINNVCRKAFHSVMIHVNHVSESKGSNDPVIANLCNRVMLFASL